MQEKEWCPVEINHGAICSLAQFTQIIIAALNEERGIALTIRELKAKLTNSPILVVDGKSNDNTIHIAKALGANVIQQKGVGKGDALRCGFKYIAASTAYIVLSDADYTYPAEYIPQMIKILIKNPQIGMVCGNRFNSFFPLKGMTETFHFGNKLIATAHAILTGIALKDPLTGLRVIRAEIVRDWNPESKDFDIEVELNNHVERKGFEIVEFPISYRPRVGEKKLKVRDGAHILRRILLESLNP